MSGSLLRSDRAGKARPAASTASGWRVPSWMLRYSQFSDLPAIQFAFAKRGCGVQRDVLLLRAGINLAIADAARQWLTSIAMAANGFEISMVPRSRVHGVRFVAIKGEQVLAPAMLVWNPAYFPPTLRSFVGWAEKVLKDSAVWGQLISLYVTPVAARGPVNGTIPRRLPPTTLMHQRRPAQISGIQAVSASRQGYARCSKRFQE